MRFSLFFFKKTPWFLPLFSSEACCLRLRGNGCINELLFFFQRTLFPLHFLSLSPFPHSGDCIKPLTPAFYPLSCSLAFILHFTRDFFICYNHVEKEFLRHCLKFARTFHFTYKERMWSEPAGEKANVIRQKRQIFQLTLVSAGHCCSVCSCHKPTVSV